VTRAPNAVIPAKAGIHLDRIAGRQKENGFFRGNDVGKEVFADLVMTMIQL
jgi:hypothetical protein